MANFKVATLFLVAILLRSSDPCYSARSEPGFPDGPLTRKQHKVVDPENAEVMVESCEGVGEEDCLIMRTLSAQSDYVYTKVGRRGPSWPNPPNNP